MLQQPVYLDVTFLADYQKITEQDSSIMLEATGKKKRLLQLQLYCKNQGIENKLFEPACHYLIDYWPRFFPQFNLHEAFYQFSVSGDFTLILSYTQNRRVAKEIKDQVQENASNLFSICLQEANQAEEELRVEALKKKNAHIKKLENKMKHLELNNSKKNKKELTTSKKSSDEEQLLLSEIWEEKFNALAIDTINLRKKMASTESDNEELNKEILRQQAEIKKAKKTWTSQHPGTSLNTKVENGTIPSDEYKQQSVKKEESLNLLRQSISNSEDRQTQLSKEPHKNLEKNEVTWQEKYAQSEADKITLSADLITKLKSARARADNMRDKNQFLIKKLEEKNNEIRALNNALTDKNVASLEEELHRAKTKLITLEFELNQANLKNEKVELESQAIASQIADMQASLKSFEKERDLIFAKIEEATFSNERTLT